jgi:integrase
MASLRKRGNVWYGVWWEGPRSKRRKRFKSFHTSNHKTAVKELVKLNEDIEARKSGHESEMSWRTFCRQYLEWSQTHKSEECRKRDELVIRQFDEIVPVGELKDLLPYQLERFKIERKKSVKESTINRDMNTLKNMTKMADQWGYLRTDPWKSVKKFQLDEAAPTTFSGQEEAIRGACHTPYELALCDLGLYQGLRRGEMANLMWDDIDFKGGMMRVVSTMGRRTKSKRERMLPIHQKTAKSLKKLSRGPGNGFVLAYNGNKAVADTLTHKFSRILARAGIPGHLHLTRHTQGTNLGHAKVDPNTIMDIMGHSRFTTTQIYLHTNEEVKRRAIDALV